MSIRLCQKQNISLPFSLSNALELMKCTTSSQVNYESHERIAGESHYPLSKMRGLAFDGITSLSIKPIRIIISFGMIVITGSLMAILWVIITALSGHSITGWASMMCV